MKSVPKLISRFVGVLFISLFLLVILNFFIIYVLSSNQLPNGAPYIKADEVAASLIETPDGLKLEESEMNDLKDKNIWAILIDEESKSVTWKTDNVPETIPLTYTLNDISTLTTRYIEDYPTYTGNAEQGLVVLGYPKESYWKHVWPSWDYGFIENFPRNFVIALILNIALVFLIYYWITSKLTSSVNPIVQGIQNLRNKEEVNLRESGALSELSLNINQTSQILQSQEKELKKKETARSNWIAGVSHDIRTPLSMVMGYAGQLETSDTLTRADQKKVKVIIRQSEKMRDLINDLNLSSKLEYNMQPINSEYINMIALVRQIVVDFMNTDIYNKYPIKWIFDEKENPIMVKADSDLINRAITNLIHNSINHNTNGCTIYISVRREKGSCIITVEDDGVGTTDQKIDELNNKSHYMLSDESTTEQRHGLGLILVKQIMASHKGKMAIAHSSYGGFAVKLKFKI